MVKHSIQKNPLVSGKIDGIYGDLLAGWISCAFSPVKASLFVDGKPATIMGWDMKRPDVEKALGISCTPGFAFRLPPAKAGAIITLYGVTTDNVYLVESKKLDLPVYESNFISAARSAAAIAAKKDTVAIVCWDGAHNPIGRAKVLFDIVSTHRPAILICYLHDEFGKNLWLPLINSDIPIVAIPWKGREIYHALLRQYNVSFNTVWICKPRLPSFMLAAAISHKDTRYILDIDDNEEAFIAAQKDSRASYNYLGLNLAKLLADKIKSRTVVSPTLRKLYGGLIVRHARKQFNLNSATPQKEAYDLAFIGTARPHKNVDAIGRAIKLSSLSCGLPMRFHVYGEPSPSEYGAQLAANGAIMHKMVPLETLPVDLSKMNIAITGFPGKENTQITDAQVSAKISDALACGLPVLTPDTPAIADLKNITGIFPFTEKNFNEQLLNAAKCKDKIRLPEDFTLKGAYRTFCEAEKQSAPVPELKMFFPSEKPVYIETKPALVLLWKQYDAGLYGRRVDQIARSYKRHFPDHQVVILELYARQVFEREKEEIANDSFCDEKSQRLSLQCKKMKGTTIDGIYYYTIVYDGENLKEKLLGFLIEHTLLPDNTLFVIFPVIQDWRLICELLRPYSYIVDIVDNQISWAEDKARHCYVLEQYFSLMGSAQAVVFNSEKMRDFCTEVGLLEAIKNSYVIPNWYTLPDNLEIEHKSLSDKDIHLFYSGNMNDRIDWHLLQAIAELPNVYLHLAGTAESASDELKRLLFRTNIIYHGIVSERQALSLLSNMDAAIVPHLFDAISAYMNPIKVRMYEAMHVPAFCPEKLAIKGVHIISYTDLNDCLKKITAFKNDGKDFQTANKGTDAEEAYMSLLGKTRAEVFAA